MACAETPPRTPDGRYIVVRGRLWRVSNPGLDDEVRQRLVKQLMHARRAVAAGNRTNDTAAVLRARAQVDQAKQALGERGPVWWTDGSPDLNRRMAKSTPYAQWYAAVEHRAVRV
ncbi:MAG: hypothetical protein ACRYGA_07075 [Janthinobacterium lividum]